MMAPAQRETTVMDERRWQQVGGAGGIFAVVVLIGLVVAVASTTSTSQPPYDGPAQGWLAFLAGANATIVPRTVTGFLAIASFLLFTAALALRLRTPDRQLGVPSILVLLAGGIAMTLDLLLSAITFSAFFRVSDLDPAMASLLAGLNGGVSLALGFAFAGMLVAAGVGALESGALPRWLAWLGIVDGVVWLGTELFPRTSLLYLPYLVFFVWVIAVSIVMLRRDRVSPNP